MKKSVKKHEAEVSYCGNEIDAVELGMLLWIWKCILVNGEPATQEFIKTRLEALFNTPIHNWPGAVQDMKRRKNPVAKLTILTRQLLAHLEKLATDHPRWM